MTNEQKRIQRMLAITLIDVMPLSDGEATPHWAKFKSNFELYFEQTKENKDFVKSEYQRLKENADFSDLTAIAQS